MKVLGIESSCDEASAAVVDYTLGQRVRVLSLETFSQIQLHQPYGGVVPEIASRNHLETLLPVIDAALKKAEVDLAQLDGIAVTHQPGLVGALLMGVTAAKTLAYASGKPLVPVHHLEGHIMSLYLDDLGDSDSIRYPLLVALVSGGHTELHVIDAPPENWEPNFLSRTRIGRSRDDAAGEAFDKTAKLLAFPYPGGRWLEQEARRGSGRPDAYALPRALRHEDTYDFSFSGLKTAVAQLVLQLEPGSKDGGPSQQKADLCASIQEAIVDALLMKITRALRSYGCQTLGMVGGVAANQYLRERALAAVTTFGASAIYPALPYCTDNAAMIAARGAVSLMQGHTLCLEALLRLNAYPREEDPVIGPRQSAMKRVCP